MTIVTQAVNGYEHLYLLFNDQGSIESKNLRDQHQHEGQPVIPLILNQLIANVLAETDILFGGYTEPPLESRHKDRLEKYQW